MMYESARNGGAWVECDCNLTGVEYMIRQNNGTFRTDVGSDAIRKQGVVMTDREGELLIDAISSYTYSYS